jgi:NAD(P)-dependent dehydrogenase (short-subunit alcohol dehydrogenase family)
VVLTGASSGIGRAVAKKLLDLNATVIIGCRSNSTCHEAIQHLTSSSSAKGRIIQKSLDLNDLASIKQFAQGVKKEYKLIDILINNAGAISSPGARTVQGLESSIGSMHVGHFALTRWLLDALQRAVPKDSNRPESSRIINVASLAFTNGVFDTSLLLGTGEGDLRGEVTDNCPRYVNVGFGLTLSCCPFFACPYTNGYARAKLANILHAQELQRRLDIAATKSMRRGMSDKRRVVTASLHPGSVATDISSFLSSPATRIFLRSADEAANIVIYAALNDDFVPGSYIDSMSHAHDLNKYRTTFLSNQITAFPYASDLPFSKRNCKLYAPTWDVDAWLWSSMKMTTPASAAAANYNTSTESISSNTLAARLYDISNQLVTDFEKKKPLFSTPVTTSKDTL